MLTDMFERLFYRESGDGLMYNTKPKPVKDYGFDEGLMSLEEAEKMFQKHLTAAKTLLSELRDKRVNLKAEMADTEATIAET